LNALPNLEKERESADDDEMGIEDILALNPPELEGHDAYVWSWYQEHVNQFVYDFNLMPVLIEKLGLKEIELSLFLMKMNMILEFKQKMSAKKQDPGSGE
jgi:hypothetical protein